MKGLFITFEGVEGSGKSTQVGLLASKMKEEGYDLVVTREPGGTRIGELIRNITHGRENVDLTGVTEAYLMSGARAQLVREIIGPALADGKIVIADRFVDSSLSYQGFGRNLGEATIEQLNNLAIEGILPHLTIFLDVTPEVGFARRNDTDKVDRLDLQQKDFYDRVYEGYKRLAEKHKERYFVVDANKSIEEVATIIWEKVKKSLKLNDFLLSRT